MNPQKDYSKYTPEVARALITFHRKFGDQLHYHIDNHGNIEDDSYYELEIKIFQDRPGDDEIVVTGVSCKDRFNSLINDITAMGFGVEMSEKTEEYKGKKLSVHNATLTGITSVAEDADWNYPHILVYGSLNPVVEDALRAHLGHRDVSFADIRNHYVIYGKEVDDIGFHKVRDSVPEFESSQIGLANRI